jgi:hypothetical protein
MYNRNVTFDHLHASCPTYSMAADRRQLKYNTYHVVICLCTANSFTYVNMYYIWVPSVTCSMYRLHSFIYGYYFHTVLKFNQNCRKYFFRTLPFCDFWCRWRGTDARACARAHTHTHTQCCFIYVLIFRSDKVQFCPSVCAIHLIFLCLLLWLPRTHWWNFYSHYHLFRHPYWLISSKFCLKLNIYIWF